MLGIQKFFFGFPFYELTKLSGIRDELSRFVLKSLRSLAWSHLIQNQNWITLIRAHALSSFFIFIKALNFNWVKSRLWNCVYCLVHETLLFSWIHHVHVHVHVSIEAHSLFLHKSPASYLLMKVKSKCQSKATRPTWFKSTCIPILSLIFSHSSCVCLST